MAIRIDKENNTTKEEWLHKYADNVETVVERVPEYSFPTYSVSGPDKFTDIATYHITCVEKYKVTLSSDTIEYLCKVHDMALGQPRDPWNQYGSSYSNHDTPAERWIRSRMRDDRDEEKMRNSNPTLKEAWDQYQFLKTLSGN